MPRERERVHADAPRPVGLDRQLDVLAVAPGRDRPQHGALAADEVLHLEVQRQPVVDLQQLVVRPQLLLGYAVRLAHLLDTSLLLVDERVDRLCTSGANVSFSPGRCRGGRCRSRGRASRRALRRIVLVADRGDLRAVEGEVEMICTSRKLRGLTGRSGRAGWGPAPRSPTRRRGAPSRRRRRAAWLRGLEALVAPGLGEVARQDGMVGLEDALPGVAGVSHDHRAPSIALAGRDGPSTGRTTEGMTPAGRLEDRPRAFA